jgi:hypothetical protein
VEETKDKVERINLIPVFALLNARQVLNGTAFQSSRANVIRIKVICEGQFVDEYEPIDGDCKLNETPCAIRKR